MWRGPRGGRWTSGRRSCGCATLCGVWASHGQRPWNRTWGLTMDCEGSMVLTVLKLFSGSLLIFRSSASRVYWDNSLSPETRWNFEYCWNLKRLWKQTWVRQRTLVRHKNNEVLRLVSQLKDELAHLQKKKFYKIFHKRFKWFISYLGVEWKIVEIELARMLLWIPSGQGNRVCPSRKDFCWNEANVNKILTSLHYNTGCPICLCTLVELTLIYDISLSTKFCVGS